MIPEARLDIALRIQSGKVAEVRIQSSRQVQAARLFAGRRPDEISRLLPTVFALCGTAQVLAGLGAMEQAAGLPLSAAQAPARQLMLLAETVAEHGLGIARDWPMLAGDAPDLPAARNIRTALAGIRGALYPDGDWHSPGGGALTPHPERIAAAIAAVRKTLTDLLSADPAAITADFDAFRAWMDAAPSPAARFLAMMTGTGLAGFGRGPFLPMPEQGPADLSARLDGDRDGRYTARPDSAGRIYETGPLARAAWHPVVSGLLGMHGTGLLVRLSARLVEVVSSLQEMALLVQDLNAGQARSDNMGPACLVNGTGLGLVEAARGLLAHRVELENGRVTRYQILAPTEWNFHPDGPLTRGLTGAEATPDLLRNANLLVHALDPCVACTVTMV